VEDSKKNHYESNILKVLTLKRILATLHHYETHNKPQPSSCWSSTPTGFIKLIFDGATIGNLGKVGYGGAFRNKQGIIYRTYTSKLGINNNNVSELHALEEGLKITKENCFTKIIAKGDS
jgi:hypothetical protein